MLSPGSKIILFRTRTDDDPFEALFEAEGWRVESVPVLSFRFVNLDRLRLKLAQMADYAGIIVTSPRSGDTLGEMFAADRALLQKWKQKPVVCIGDRTASALVRAGLEPVVAERASSEGVADQVAGLNRVGKWLFLCGSLRRDELPLSLIRAGMAFEELVIYHTLPQEHINLNRLETPDWVVFFSPSGVDAVRKIWPERWKHVQKAAIGNATASAIDAAGWKVGTVAEKPEASSLLEAVSQQV